MSNMPSAVRLYAPDHPALPLTTRKRLEEARNKHIADLGSGYAEDFPDYRYRAGRIQGLLDAIEIAREIEAEMNKER